MLEYEDIFDQLNIMGYLKTIEMMPFVTEIVTERHCRKCKRWDKTKCSFLGKILNPDSCDCSWWKEKSSNDGHQYKCSRCAIDYATNWKNDNKTNTKSM